MSEDYSVFDYEGDDSNAVTKKTRRPQNRARAWTREDIWRCCHERLGAETFEERKINAKNEIKARILLMMGDVLLPQIHFIFIVLNCESLEHPKEDYEIPVRCYVQSRQISKHLLDSKFEASATWQPLSGGLYESNAFREDERIQPPWETCVIHGHQHASNRQKIDVSALILDVEAKMTQKKYSYLRE